MRRVPLVCALLASALVGCRSGSSTSPATNLAQWRAAPAADGHILSLAEQVGDQPVIPVGNGIVDVNSVVHVQLDKERIGPAVPAEWNAEFPPERLATLKRLSKAVEDGQKGIDALRGALIEWSTDHDSVKLQAVFTAYAKPFDVIIDEIDGRPELRARFISEQEALFARGEFSQIEQDKVALGLAADLVQREQLAWRAFLEENGIFFQLGAWLLSGQQTTPIHLPGFDDYPEQEYYEVERWSIRFDAQQQEQFAEIQRTAKKLNDDLVQPSGFFRAYADVLVAAVKDALGTCEVEFEEALRKLVTEVQAGVALEPDPKKLLVQVQELAVELRGLMAKYESLELEDPMQVLAALDGLRTDVSNLKKDVEAIVADAQALIAALTAVADTDVLKEILAKLEATAGSQATACLVTLSEGLAPLLRALGLDLAAAELNEELLEFTDQVLRHTLDSLPTSTEFDLHTSGRREAGDRVVVKLAVGREQPGPTGVPKPERVVLDVRRLTLHRILPHLTTTVGLIWANPSRSTALTRDYQAGAAYSVLYKWGDRDSEAFNSLWTPGIGLNLSALDLDKDDNPELGVAAVLSLVRDYIQVGYGFDPAVDTGYWFFGFRLPLPTWSLPGGQDADVGNP